MTGHLHRRGPRPRPLDPGPRPSPRSPLLALRARDPQQSHRTASPLELFFDLVFVVAVSAASVELHHALSEGHVLTGSTGYLTVFFSLWWGWVNFTWFASAFDTDDWLYRVLTLVQMGGVLVLAAGVHAAAVDGDLRTVTAGYVVMRLALLAQWLRAAHGEVALRRTALRFAAGITVTQSAWVARLALPEQGGPATFVLLALAEVAVPVWAERARATPWHPRHIAERYGLFTLIVLGESVLAAANALIDALEDTEHLPGLLLLAACALVMAAGMWWIYFAGEHHRRLGSLREGLRYGYGHFLVFAAAGAYSAGVEVLIDHEAGTGHLSARAAAATVTVPVAVFLLTVWALVLRHELPRAHSTALLLTSIAVGLCALAPGAGVLAATVVVVAVVVVERGTRRTSLPAAADAAVPAGGAAAGV